MSTTSTISNFIPSLPPQLFNRAYALSIGNPALIAVSPAVAAVAFSNQPSPIGSFPQPAAPFRITFDIDRNLYGSSPNKSKFQIYNLQAQHRDLIQPGFVLQLKAGYQSLMDTIYNGNISLKGGVKNIRKGPDIITEFECGEGEQAIVMANLDISFPGPTTLPIIIAAIAEVMTGNEVVTDFTVNSVVYSAVIPPVPYPRGLAVAGPCKDTLTKLLKNQGLRWTIQNGSLYILAVNAPINPVTAVVLSSGVTTDIEGNVSFNPNASTGLIGVPSKNGSFVSFTALLNPNLLPGSYVQIISEVTSLNGFYKINRAHYIGDTHDNKWHVVCETTNPTPTLAGVVGL